MQTAAQELGLKTCFSIESDDTTVVPGDLVRTELLDNPNLVVRNVANPYKPGDHNKRRNNRECPKEQRDKHKCSPPAAFVHGATNSAPISISDH